MNIKRNRRLASIPPLIVGILFINIGLGGGQRRAFIGVGIAPLVRQNRP